MHHYESNAHLGSGLAGGFLFQWCVLCDRSHPPNPCKLMSAETVVAEIESLPPTERAKVSAYVNDAMTADESWIPESFRQGMAEAEAGRLASMETILSGARPPTGIK